MTEGIRPSDKQIQRLEGQISTATRHLNEGRPIRLAIPIYKGHKPIYSQRMPIAEQFIFGMMTVLRSQEMQEPREVFTYQGDQGDERGT